MPETETELSEDVVAEAERLTRLARNAVDENAAEAYRDRRDDELDEYGFVARVRDDDTLVCYPEEWLDDSGTVRTERIEDTDRAAEVSLAGPGEQGDYEQATERNAELVEQVGEAYGEIHASNAQAFANFMNNHYARPMDSASAREVEEFATDYYPRNAWPTEDEKRVVAESLRYVFAVAEKEFPGLNAP